MSATVYQARILVDSRDDGTTRRLWCAKVMLRPENRSDLERVGLGEAKREEVAILRAWDVAFAKLKAGGRRRTPGE